MKTALDFPGDDIDDGAKESPWSEIAFALNRNAARLAQKPDDRFDTSLPGAHRPDCVLQAAGPVEPLRQAKFLPNASRTNPPILLEHRLLNKSNGAAFPGSLRQFDVKPALLWGGIGATLGAGAVTPIALMEAHLVNNVGWLLRPFLLGSLALQPASPVSYGAVAWRAGLKGGLIGLGAGLTAYGAYMGYKFLESRLRCEQ